MLVLLLKKTFKTFVINQVKFPFQEVFFSFFEKRDWSFKKYFESDRIS